MMEGRGRLKEYIPHLLMTTCFLTLAVLIVLVQSLQSDVDFSPAIFTFYEHFISTFLLSILAFYCERGKRPPLTLNVFLWAFFLGFLQIPLGHLLLTQSLSYISATFQSTALNTTGAVTFLMAVILGKEALQFYTINGQAKLWGIVLSVIGASIMVLWSGPRLGPLLGFSDIGARVIGCLMVLGALFFGCAASLLVEHVATRYRADMSLSAMMCFCGALQTAIIAGLTEKSSAWKTNLYGSYELLVILYGGIVVSGLGYYMQTWCIHKKGPVFTAAFNPLLIVFSFVLETLAFRKDAHLGSILGAIFVIAGLYLILWAKADENEEKQNTSYLLASTYEQLS